MVDASMLGVADASTEAAAVAGAAPLAPGAGEAFPIGEGPAAWPQPSSSRVTSGTSHEDRALTRTAWIDPPGPANGRERRFATQWRCRDCGRQADAGAVDWRTIRLGVTTTSCTTAPVVRPSIMSRRRFAEIRPISTPDWLTVVSGGIVNE